MRKLIVMALCLLPTAINSHIFQVATLSNGNQTVVVCSDYHTSHQHATTNDLVQQQEAILDYAGKQNALVIVEDAYCGNLRTIAQDETASIEPTPFPLSQEQIHARLTSPLTYLFTRCVQQKIQVRNVETRFSEFRTATNYVRYVETMLQKLNEDLLESRFKRTCSPILSTLTNVLYEKASALVSFLAQHSDQLTNVLQKSGLPTIANAATVLAQLTDEPWNFDLYSPQQCSAFMLHLIEARLLELSIMRQIAQNEQHQLIIIVAGASHAHACTQLLAQEGYRICSLEGDDLCMNATRTAYEEPQALKLATLFENSTTQTLPTYRVWIPFSHLVATLITVVEKWL